MQSTLPCFAVALLSAAPLWAQGAAAPPAAPPITALTSVSPEDPVLARLLAGGDPDSPADLLRLQQHVQQLLHKVLPAVVSVPGASGVIIDGGLVLTAGHVVRTSGRKLEITMHDGTRLQGETLGANLTADTGLIRILTKGEFPCCEMGQIEGLERGDWCLMLGHPSGRKVGRDAPARLGRVLRPGARGFVVTDCTMQGGDSGGPLFDMQGRIIGINSRITNDLANNMHVPIDAFRADWDQLLAGEVVGRATNQRGSRSRIDLGVPLVFDGDTATVGEIGVELQQRGLLQGDVVLKIDGEEIHSRRDVFRALIGFDEGAMIKLEVQRGEQQHEVEVLARKVTR